MSRTALAATGAALAVGAAGLLALARAEPATPAGAAAHAGGDSALTDRGRRLYDRLCLACHGAAGDGNGPGAAWLWPKPRDFAGGEFKWRSTPVGEPPTDSDLARAIEHGVRGTSMHGFSSTLGPEQIAGLVAVVKSFQPDLYEEAGTPVDIPPPPELGDSAIARGKQLFASLGCAQCHGNEGRGDGLSAGQLKDAAGRPAPPFDLTIAPIRRPHADGEDARVLIYESMVTGLAGTPMPAYTGVASAGDLWAVAAYVDSIRAPDRPRPSNNPTDLHPEVVAMSRRVRPKPAGLSPGQSGDDARVFGRTIEFQGEPPEALAPAQASLSALRCERCHAKQVREWRPSIHANASSPGVLAQLVSLRSERSGRFIEGCQRCHAPLAEALPFVRAEHRGAGATEKAYQPNPLFDPELRKEGINCATCHVRQWRRLGPPLAGDGRLLNLPNYPVDELPIYERSDLCIGCHQLPATAMVGTKPRLNTYREWLEGPYMRRGIQCQHCHMPNREHTFKGIHDPDTFRQGIELSTLAWRNPSTGAVTVRARLKNSGAGHYLPTTPTPAAWMSVELFDKHRRPIKGARFEQRIGWHLEFTSKGWKEIADTRIPPGESLEVARAWKDGRVSDASHARIVIRVAPDDFYEGFYARRLASKLTAESRALFEQAAKRAKDSHYVAVDRIVAIE